MHSFVMKSKAEARAQGLKTYFTGKPCKRGHLEERWVSDGSCRACRNTQARDWFRYDRYASEYPEEVAALKQEQKEAEERRIALLDKPYISGEEAERLGLKFYFTGVPCKNGHVSDYWVSSRTCCECVKQTSKVYRRKWRRENPELMKQQNASYLERFPEKAAARVAKRRALKLGAFVGDRKEYEKFVKWARTARGLCCSYCGKETEPKERELDHIVPLSRGGADAVSNLCVACGSCNRRKHNKTAEEFTALTLTDTLEEINT
jgi:5-methylcytosine-specific restriction endonuclease McrA